MDDIMLRVDNVYKQYMLGQIGGTTLREEIQRWSARRKGKEDPTRIIGEAEHKTGETFMALKGVSFDVKRGERVGIIGHNGAGKSTLLKLISKVTAPTDGMIGLNGRVASMLEVGTGFHGELTGRENIYMNGAILGLTKKEIDAKLEKIIEFSEVRPFIDTPVKRYSSGMYVKLAFSVAAHLDSEIIIMDEVLAVGDMAFQKKCLDKMNEVSRSEGRTILYVSHNMNTIRQLCERVIVMDHGKIVFDGDVEEGIYIYSGVAINEFPVEYDFDSAPRPSGQHGRDFRVTKLNFEAQGQAYFYRTKPIRFSIEFEGKKQFPSIKFYFALRTSNDENVGLVQTYEGTSGIEEGKKYKYVFEFDPSNLTEGDYQFFLDAFTYDELGNHYSVDHPMQMCRFKLLDDQPIGLRWQPKYFGHIRLNPLIMVSEEEL